MSMYIYVCASRYGYYAKKTRDQINCWGTMYRTQTCIEFFIPWYLLIHASFCVPIFSNATFAINNNLPLYHDNTRLYHVHSSIKPNRAYNISNWLIYAYIYISCK